MTDDEAEDDYIDRRPEVVDHFAVCPCTPGILRLSNNPALLEKESCKCVNRADTAVPVVYHYDTDLHVIDVGTHLSSKPPTFKVSRLYRIPDVAVNGTKIIVRNWTPHAETEIKVSLESWDDRVRRTW